MKTIVKILLGLAGAYAVGKVCYEIGKDVGSVEAQINNDPDSVDLDQDDPVEYEAYDMFDWTEHVESDPKPEPEQKPEESEESTKKPEEPAKKPGFIDKLKELRSMAKIKEIFTKKDQSVLGKILTNPDGTQINASVENGEIHIKLKPKPKKRE